MIDTNVLLSALLFPGREMNTLMEKATAEHQLVLSSYVIDGLMDVTTSEIQGERESGRLAAEPASLWTRLRAWTSRTGLFDIRDEMDYPVLYSAITEDVDIFVMGDKDFDGLGLEKPEILSPAEFLERH